MRRAWHGAIGDIFILVTGIAVLAHRDYLRRGPLVARDDDARLPGEESRFWYDNSGT